VSNHRHELPPTGPPPKSIRYPQANLTVPASNCRI
jgi:hypothetical protein